MRILAEMLQIADDAQFEGRTSSTIDHDALVETTGNLRRIANRFSMISVSLLVTPALELDSITEAARQSFLDQVCRQLEVWFEFFRVPKVSTARQHDLLPKLNRELGWKNRLRPSERG